MAASRPCPHQLVLPVFCSHPVKSTTWSPSRPRR